MRIAFVDTETTGWNAVYHRVIEIGIVLVENGEVLERYESLVNPKSSVSSTITHITGLTDEDVADAPTFAEIAPKVESLLDGALFVAHNVGFDYSFLYYEFTRLQRPFHFPRACTVRLSRKLFPETPKHSLESLISHHDISVERRHRALDDAQVLYEFMKKCEARCGREELSRLMGTLTNTTRLSGI